MSDIVERLRNWRTVHLARLHLLMDEAADEMEILLERLQSYDSGYTNGISSRSDSKPALRTGSNSRETGDLLDAIAAAQTDDIEISEAEAKALDEKAPRNKPTVRAMPLPKRTR